MCLQGEESIYEDPSIFQCLKCAEGCESCEDSSPCIVTLNWVLRTILLILQCVIIGCLPVVVLFTYKYKDIKVRIFIKLKWVSHIFENIFLFSKLFLKSSIVRAFVHQNNEYYCLYCKVKTWYRNFFSYAFLEKFRVQKNAFEEFFSLTYAEKPPSEQYFFF